MARHTYGVAVVTGGGSGLGAAFVRQLAARGAAVAVSDQHLDRAEAVAAEVVAAGGRAIAHQADVRDPDAMEALAVAAEEALGPLDLWINNAGVSVAGKVGDVAPGDWRWVTEINLLGMVWGCHTAVPRFRARGRGAVINVASAAALVNGPEMAPYNITKAGVVSLSESLYGEVAALGIGVTVCCPTFFQTDLLSSHRGPDDKLVHTAGKLMRRARLSADDVARITLDDAARGRLYSVPMADGRWLWRARRAFPQGFHDVLPRMFALARRLTA